MENNEICNLKPANTINQEEKEKDFPIIRCEDCNEVVKIKFNMNKKEISLKCEKEQKKKNIPFDEFFKTLNKYHEINCCQFCNNKNEPQKYYLCKTCSNKILCEDCFQKHNKKDDVINFKIDSSCKKHYIPYESYCPICKESICVYCSTEHDEEHERKVYLLKKILFKKNEIEEFKNNINKITNMKNSIEEKINSVIKELEQKIEFLKNLEKNFFENLNMQLKFVDLVLQNYEKKMKEFDINYYIIYNLKNIFNFNLLKLNLNENDSLFKKIENISSYINNHLNSKFKFDSKEINSIEKNLISEVDYELKKEVKNLEKSLIGFIDFNKYLFVFYSSYSIEFILKENYDTKFEIEEKYQNKIKVCKKIDEEKILIFGKSGITIIKIIDNIDFIYTQKINISAEIYDFNSKLDLLYFYGKGFKLHLFPNYKGTKISNYEGNEIEIDNNKCKLEFISKDTFFIFDNTALKMLLIYGNKSKLVNELEINMDPSHSSIIELNKNYYCFNTYYRIFILNKTNLFLVKEINIENNILGLLKISDKIISIFSSNYGSIELINYDILLDGIKWNEKERKDILKGESNEEKVLMFVKSQKYVLFIKKYEYKYGSWRNQYTNSKYGWALFEIV